MSDIGKQKIHRISTFSNLDAQNFNEGDIVTIEKLVYKVSREGVDLVLKRIDDLCSTDTKFVTFEGGEGSGKTSCMTRIVEYLESRGLSVFRSREPGGSRIGKSIRSILLDVENKDLSSKAELFLYLADRAQHMDTVILPAIETHDIVLCDRFADSTIVYQGYGRKLYDNSDHLVKLNDYAISGNWPMLTIWFDVDPEVGLRRAKSRLILDGTTSSEGRFEEEALEFHRRIREGYKLQAVCNPRRYVTVDANKSPDEVFEHVKSLILNIYGLSE